MQFFLFCFLFNVIFAFTVSRELEITLSHSVSKFVVVVGNTHMSFETFLNRYTYTNFPGDLFDFCKNQLFINVFINACTLYMSTQKMFGWC